MADALVYNRTADMIERARETGALVAYEEYRTGNRLRFFSGDGTTAIGFTRDLTDAYLSYQHINRVELWTRELTDILNEHGYSITTETKANWWTRVRYPTRSEFDRIRGNVDTLHDTVVSVPNWRTIVYNDRYDWQQANAIEWDLQQLSDSIERLLVSQEFFSGLFYAGEEFSLG